MSSLRELLNRYPRLLLLDAASSVVQVGWFQPGKPPAWSRVTDEAATALFVCIEELGVSPADADGFAFCDGPGSVLGIRTTAMALRTWIASRVRPVFAYHSLALVAESLGKPEITVIADARRDSWHQFKLGRALNRVAASEVTGEIIMPENFRTWTPLPPGVSRVPYFVDELLDRSPDADLFRATDSPDAFLHEEPSYVQWTPQIHRAP